MSPKNTTTTFPYGNPEKHNARACLSGYEGLYALADVSDAHHLRAKSIVAFLQRSKRRIFTTNYVLVETHALLLSRLGHSTARAWLRTFNATVENCEHEDLKKAKEIIFLWEDKSFSLADALSFVI